MPTIQDLIGYDPTDPIQKQAMKGNAEGGPVSNPWFPRGGGGRGGRSSAGPASSFASMTSQPNPFAPSRKTMVGGAMSPTTQAGNYAPPTGTPAATGWGALAGGGSTAGSTAATYPSGSGYASDPFSKWLYDAFVGQGYNKTGLTNAAIAAMIQSGMLSPNGSPGLISLLRGQATTDANSLRARGNTVSTMAGLDPAQSASLYAQRDLGLEGGIQSSLLQPLIESIMANRQTLQGLLGSAINYNYTPGAK
jgi:hypothetical protein